MKDIVVLIPTFNPDIKIMREFINELTAKFKNVVIVNDGSRDEFKDFFEELTKLNIPILHHEVNKGKGRAIKTGFEYILKNYKNVIGTITADCDGQHCVQDIEKCAEQLRKTPQNLIIGCRNFDEKQVPIKRKIANKITRQVFYFFVGTKLSDTQSGLRGFGIKLMERFLDTAGERYEYETNMLIDCKTYGIKVKELPIQTIYIDKNETSHFNPIKAPFMIYRQFFKYKFSRKHKKRR